MTTNIDTPELEAARPPAGTNTEEPFDALDALNDIWDRKLKALLERIAMKTAYWQDILNTAPAEHARRCSIHYEAPIALKYLETRYAIAYQEMRAQHVEWLLTNTGPGRLLDGLDTLKAITHIRDYEAHMKKVESPLQEGMLTLDNSYKK